MNNVRTFQKLIHGYIPPLLLACVLSCLHLGCKKNPPNTIVQGRITAYGTGIPIEGARVYVLCDSSTVFGPSGSSLADSLLTDADGAFYREYHSDELCGSVYLLPYKEGYFKGNELDITTENRVFNIVLDPEAWLKLITIPDLGQWTHLGFGGTFRPHSVESTNGTESQIFTGRGGRKAVLHWGPSSGIVFSDSIYLTPHDTTLYTIHY